MTPSAAKVEHVISYDTWVAMYRPLISLTNDGAVQQFEYATNEQCEAIAQADKEHRLWTAIDDDWGKMAIVSGCAYVNRLYYIVTGVPHLRASHDIFIACEGENS
jgi:hypothetical protein